jgi:ferritin-like metal-binding protein YciE
MGIIDRVKLHTPEEVFTWKLGAALSMEKTVLESLQDMQKETPREEIRRLLERHEAQTREHVSRIEHAFELLGEEIDDSPCPAMQGISKEGKATLKKIDDPIVDAGILAGAIETEHHEIAVYEVLITNAQARGRDDVARLLEESLREEQQTLEEVKAIEERLAKHEGYAVAA